MILDENFDLIKPDIVLWQYCGNDFINNSFDLEYHSSVNNNGMLRPYLTGDGTISYLIPRSHPYVRTLANNYSQFLYLIISRLDRLQAMQAGERRADTAETVENEITAQGAKHPGFRHSAMITKEIMGRVRLRCGAARLIAFCSDDEEPYYSEFRRISHESGFEFIDGVPQGIRAAEQRGGLVRAADNAHWNELGHRMVADAVIRYLKKHEQN
jgi:hypothetical protein